MLETLQQLWKFLNARKKYWLVPVIFALLLAGALVMAQGPLGPFVYAIF